MKTRSEFLQALSGLGLTHAGRAIALLWYYRQTQEFEERTASELADDLLDEGFPKPNVTRLHDELRRSRYVVRGRKTSMYQLDARRLRDLDERYSEILALRKVKVSATIIPSDWFEGSRPYLERLVYQINGCYEYAFYDACGALTRRLMETLIIEIYVHQKRQHEIQKNGVFLPLERLIAHIRSDQEVTLSRNAPKTMTEIKQLGDTAAHDRVYITEQIDIDDVKARYRKLIRELFALSGISK